MKEYKLTEKEINGKTHYFASFTDGQGQGQTIEIDKEVYEALNESQKSVHSQIRQDRRYGLLSFDENIGESGMIYECERTDELIQKVLEHMGNLTDLQVQLGGICTCRNPCHTLTESGRGLPDRRLTSIFSSGWKVTNATSRF